MYTNLVLLLSAAYQMWRSTSTVRNLDVLRVPSSGDHSLWLIIFSFDNYSICGTATEQDSDKPGQPLERGLVYNDVLSISKAVLICIMENP